MFMAFHSDGQRKRILVWATLSLLLLGIGVGLSITR